MNVSTPNQSESSYRADTTTGASAYNEGPIARSIEKQTAKLPSDIFLWAAGASIIGSLVLQAMKPSRTALFTGGRRTSELSTFVGHWAPTLLLLGLYNKLVKVAGSDRNHV